jgi:hypothetical protein
VAIAPCGTFDYVGIVPSGLPIDGGLSIAASPRERIEPRGERLMDNRLLGYRPRIVVWWNHLAIVADVKSFGVAR